MRTPRPRQRPQGPNRGDWRRPPAPPQCPAHLWSGCRRCTDGVTPQRRPSDGCIRPDPPRTEFVPVCAHLGRGRAPRGPTAAIGGGHPRPPSAQLTCGVGSGGVPTGRHRSAAPAMDTSGPTPREPNSPPHGHTPAAAAPPGARPRRLAAATRAPPVPSSPVEWVPAVYRRGDPAAPLLPVRRRSGAARSYNTYKSAVSSSTGRFCAYISEM